MSVSIGGPPPSPDVLAAGAAEASTSVSVGGNASGSADREAVGQAVPERFHLVCWNVRKAGDSLFRQELESLIRDVPSVDEIILCLQEARPSTYRVIEELEHGGSSVSGHYAESWRSPMSDHASGVLTVSRRSLPAVSGERMATDHREFFVTSPKVSLRSKLELSDGRDLLVLNCHGLNFVPDRLFRAQLDQVFSGIAAGAVDPSSNSASADAVIVCGDFNVWSQSRLELLEAKVREVGLTEASVGDRQGVAVAEWLWGTLERLVGFDPEIPLDRIYTRGVKVVECREVDGTSTSDHAPLVLEFELAP